MLDAAQAASAGCRATKVGAGAGDAPERSAPTSITWCEFGANLAARLDPVRPGDDRPVPRAAPVRSDLLRPLVRRVHRVCPADARSRCRTSGAAEVVEPLHHELDRLERNGAVEVDHLVVGPVERAFGGGAVVADDDVDERVRRGRPGRRARRAAGRRGGR